MKIAAKKLWPPKTDDVTVRVDGHDVHLTHLTKKFWPKLGVSKGDLLQYYAEIAPVLLPHLKDRAMVMKRYPNGAEGEFFFMKRIPESHPEWIKTCPIEHAAKGVIHFPVVQDTATLLWIVNLGCIDLNPWYGRCPRSDVPDYLHFDLDPGPNVSFARARDVALIIHEALSKLKMPNYAKTSGSKGIHVYVPIVPGPKQKEVWTFAKALAWTLAERYPKLITAEYRIEKRPPGRVLVDYNQNAWGHTLASVYSVRPKPKATVSAPVSWKEIEDKIEIEDFRIDNMRLRVQKKGDLWAPVDGNKGRFPLAAFALASG
jgi:bifunctional non-homologous end joining protein LigD